MLTQWLTIHKRQPFCWRKLASSIHFFGDLIVIHGTYDWSMIDVKKQTSTTHDCVDVFWWNYTGIGKILKYLNVNQTKHQPVKSMRWNLSRLVINSNMQANKLKAFDLLLVCWKYDFEHTHTHLCEFIAKRAGFNCILFTERNSILNIKWNSNHSVYESAIL